MFVQCALCVRVYSEGSSMIGQCEVSRQDSSKLVDSRRGGGNKDMGGGQSTSEALKKNYIFKQKGRWKYVTSCFRFS